LGQKANPKKLVSKGQKKRNLPGMGKKRNCRLEGKNFRPHPPRAKKERPLHIMRESDYHWRAGPKGKMVTSKGRVGRKKKMLVQEWKQTDDRRR